MADLGSAIFGILWYNQPMAQNNKFQAGLDVSRGLFYLFLIVYGAYVIGKAIQNNFATNQQIRLLREEIAALNDEIDGLKNTIIYFQTDSFKELEARRRLGLRGAGETVIMLPKNDKQNINSQIQNPQEKIDQEQEKTPNPVKWFQYIFY